LSAALEAQAQEFETRTGILCTVTLPQEPLVLDADISTAVFRIFQESLTNVPRHAHRHARRGTLGKAKTRITFQVSDNGEASIRKS